MLCISVFFGELSWWLFFFFLCFHLDVFLDGFGVLFLFSCMFYEFFSALCVCLWLLDLSVLCLKCCVSCVFFVECIVVLV